jgi:Domain of unknown function (DUF4252)
MKLWMTGIGVVLVCGLAGPGRVLAGTPSEDVTKHPGYVDFGTVNLFGSKPPDVEVLIEKPLIEMVKVFAANDDPELANMLSKLMQISVQVFAIDRDNLTAIEKRTDEVSGKLEAQGWSRIIKVNKRAEGDQTYIYLKMKDNKVQGLALMNVDSQKEEATFANIVGEVDPEQLGRLQHKFNIEGLDSLDIDMHGKSSLKH